MANCSKEVAALTESLRDHTSVPVADDLTNWHIRPFRDALIFTRFRTPRGGAFYLVRGDQVRPVHLASTTIDEEYATFTD